MPNLYKNPWFHIKKPAPQAKVRLFCFPYAGGSAQVFQAWHESLPSDIEIIGVQYPGRNSRFADPLIPSCQGIVEALLPNILPGLNKPFMFFGHSNGSLLSFELARELQRRGIDQQLHHFLSAKRAIHLPRKKKITYNLPDDEFLLELENLGGTPPEILANRELMQLFMPVLRADFSHHETFTYQGEDKLKCNATLLYGEKDYDVPIEDVMSWQDLIEKPVDTQDFSGDHFFINSQSEQLLSFLNGRIKDILQNH